MSTQYTLAALTALSLVSTPTFAREVQAGDEAPRSAAVSYADLNLNTPDGQAVLVARIHRAAEAVCGPEPDSRDLKRLPPYRQCMKQSVDTAVAAIPSPSQMAGKVKPAG
ncbi:MAG: UrcA family protein [Caulobacteraceae bacterium]